MKTSGEPQTSLDRVALLVGSGVLGAGTGLVLGLALLLCSQFLAVDFFGVAAVRFCLAYVPLGFGCLAAVGGLLSPDKTADALAQVWHVIAKLFSWS
ncbi:MAG TPA: hypothetical protein VGH80_13770 [Xanthomonadaceae bacterium]|jgi:hypothetical protein